MKKKIVLYLLIINKFHNFKIKLKYMLWKIQKLPLDEEKAKLDNFLQTIEFED
ncbi:hypothetical protein MBIO_0453 [Mycoplasmopsis fermentans PG18]|uniref:Uncharacterized protein n=1 Tax=Mycoplasmopsis fermentans (strain ATCC 19989 / NBRC 14854 / NCTC 10117 / PG18) TaxID=496833 RepID=C4XEZ6_MYCFP|nr:hypothetical protein MBIO_0453 [Mycoplasmopsis fermentans PG18]